MEIKQINEKLIQKRECDKDCFAHIERAQNEGRFGRIEQNIVTLAKTMESHANFAGGLNSTIEATNKS